MIAQLKHAVRVARSIVREKLKKRSSEWPQLRNMHLAAYPQCAACGGTRVAQVHHVRPFHLAPASELDPDNLVTLCMGPHECHLRIGHGDEFEAYNPNVLIDSAIAKLHPAQRGLVEQKAKAARLYSAPSKR